MKMKRILSIVCAFALALSLTMGFAQAKADGTQKRAYITIEKLTIGQGLLLEPTSISLSDDDTVTTVFKKAANIAGLDYDADETYGFYLTNIKNADTGVVNIPSAIANMPQYDYDWGGGYSGTYYAPSNENNDGNADSDLGQYDYNQMSGWMFSQNNLSVNDMSAAVEDGDVIRVQFTLFGYGNDIGFGWDPDTNLKVANRDALIKRVADIQEDPDALAKYDTEFTAAKNVLSKYESTQDEVDAALSALSEEQTTVAPTTTKTPATTKITVAKASIKSIKNIKKRKAIITVKPVAGATGYVFKYSKYKSLKNAIRKDTTKTFIKTKKFKKKQTCYAKVQAYKVVNGEKHFGKWSKVKKVKIKK